MYYIDVVDNSKIVFVAPMIDLVTQQLKLIKRFMSADQREKVCVVLRLFCGANSALS